MRALWALCCVCVIACDGSGSAELQQAGGSGPPICVDTPRMPWPQVTNPNHHRVLMPPHLITIAPSNFRGPGEFVAITEYVATLVKDDWLLQIAEDYVDDPALLQPGTHDEFVGDPLVIPCPPCPHPPFVCGFCPTLLTRLQVEQYIQFQMFKHPEIATGPNDIYIVLFPRHVNVPFTATRGVATFHADFSELGGSDLQARDSAWEAIQHNDKVFDLDDYTLTISHETAEAITDTASAWALRFDPSAPVTTQSPWNAIGNEIGDLCAGAKMLITGTFGTYVVERPLSNSRAAGQGDPCIPSGTATYFNTTMPTINNLPISEWTLATSKTVTIPIRGWIAGTQCDVTWSISATPQKFSGTPPKSFTPKLAKLDKSTLSNGEGATLTVKIPAGTKAGSFGVVRVRSTPMLPVPRGTDTSNDAYYGIFVPNDL
jgi:hypothetical protein